MKRTILPLITVGCTSLALQAQMPQSYTLKSCLESKQLLVAHYP